jgi:hypothetical protein
MHTHTHTLTSLHLEDAVLEDLTRPSPRAHHCLNLLRSGVRLHDLELALHLLLDVRLELLLAVLVRLHHLHELASECVHKVFTNTDFVFLATRGGGLLALSVFA